MNLFTDIRIVDPQSPHHHQQADVLIEESRIAKIAAPNTLDIPESRKIITPEAACMSPGWIDMQVHVQDPGFEWKESLENLAQAAMRGGFTGIHCLTDTDPVADNAQVIHSLQRRSSSLPVEFYFSGALTHQGKGKDLAEIYEMQEAGAVSFSDRITLTHETGVMLRALEYAKAFEGLICCYPFDASLGSSGMVNEGAQAAALGMKGIPELAEVLGVEKVLHLASYAEVPVHFLSITSYEALEAIQQAKEKGLRVSVSVGLPYVAFTDSHLSGFESIYKVFPPLRSGDQVALLKQAIEKGWVDALSSCHLAQGVEEKNLEFGQAEYGMLGLQTAFSMINQRLIQPGILDLARMIQLLCIGPRNILKQPPVKIEEGFEANLTVFNPEAKWILSGEELPSRAKNSPFLGHNLEGNIIGTYLKGVYHPRE